MSRCDGIQGIHVEPLTGWFTLSDRPEAIVRMGLARFDEQGKLRAFPRSLVHIFPRSDGTVRVRFPAWGVRRVDERFASALERLTHGASCSDFSLPKAPRARSMRR